MTYIVTAERTYPPYHPGEWALAETFEVGEASSYSGAERLVGTHAIETFPQFTFDTGYRDPLRDVGEYAYEGPMPDDDGTVVYSIQPAIELKSAA